jgi:hypothetical protein
MSTSPVSDTAVMFAPLRGVNCPVWGVYTVLKSPPVFPPSSGWLWLSREEEGAASLWERRTRQWEKGRTVLYLFLLAARPCLMRCMRLLLMFTCVICCSTSISTSRWSNMSPPSRTTCACRYAENFSTGTSGKKKGTSLLECCCLPPTRGCDLYLASRLVGDLPSPPLGEGTANVACGLAALLITSISVLTAHESSTIRCVT